MAKSKKELSGSENAPGSVHRLEELTEEELLRRVFEAFSLLGSVSSEDIPRIDLYMDQVTTFMEQHLADTKRKTDDKVLTKTMINNYAKNKLLPPPDRKKYSREHMLLLVFIYYFKSVLPLGDIQALLGPLCDQYFSNEKGPDIRAIYDEVFQISEDDITHMREEILHLHRISYSRFQDAPPKDQQFLKFFTLISYLLLDVYMKKSLIFSLIDDYMNPV